MKKQRKLNEQINRACREVNGCPGAVMYVTEVDGRVILTKKEPVNYLFKAEYENTEVILEPKKEVKSTKPKKVSQDVQDVTDAPIDRGVE